MATFPSEDGPDRGVTIAPSPSDDETAAIVAALEQALAEPEPDDAGGVPVDPWIRACRFEAVAAFRGRPSPDAPHDPWVAMGRVRR